MMTPDHVVSWIAAVLYAIVTTLVVYQSSFASQRGQRASLILAVAGTSVHAVALALRVAASGHIPVKGNYENASTAALFITVPAAIVALRSERLRLVALWAYPLGLFALGWALLHPDGVTPLTPAYQSTWLVIHVVFANLSYGAYSLACGAGAVWLFKDWRQRNDKPLGVLERVPDLEHLADLTFRLVVFGFVTSAMMIIAGSFWADALWGTYWNWDPVETWSLISWLIYGSYIHLWVVHRWRGRRMAWLAVIAIGLVIVSFWGVNFLRSGHSFNSF